MVSAARVRAFIRALKRKSRPGKGRGSRGRAAGLSEADRECVWEWVLSQPKRQGWRGVFKNYRACAGALESKYGRAFNCWAIRVEFQRFVRTV